MAVDFAAYNETSVALFTRAWIEIYINSNRTRRYYVALFTRAWIEIEAFCSDNANYHVALFTRAWIEIPAHLSRAGGCVRRPLYEGVD